MQPTFFETPSDFRAWLAENPQHKHGVHRYDLAQFGLDPAEVDRQFAGYRDRIAQGSAAGA